jgi:hypothetical protein
MFEIIFNVILNVFQGRSFRLSQVFLTAAAIAFRLGHPAEECRPNDHVYGGGDG